MFAEEVNNGVAQGKGFPEIFGLLGEDADLGELRDTFRRKAFKRRQEAVIIDLRAAGQADGDVAALILAAFDAFSCGSAEADGRKARYRQALLLRWPDLKPGERVLVDYDGKAVTAGMMPAYLAELRSVRINMEFNGALCRGLKTTRYKELDMVDGEPTLVDFIMDRVPARATHMQPSKR
jgi:hypothetical protein